MDQRSLTAPASILVVDDDPIVRSLMRATLAHDGFVVIEAEDGVEGCQLYELFDCCSHLTILLKCFTRAKRRPMPPG